jgi:hypothetical protein
MDDTKVPVDKNSEVPEEKGPEVPVDKNLEVPVAEAKKCFASPVTNCDPAAPRRLQFLQRASRNPQQITLRVGPAVALVIGHANKTR